MVANMEMESTTSVESDGIEQPPHSGQGLNAPSCVTDEALSGGHVWMGDP